MKEFNELYNLYSKDIYKYLLYQTGNTLDAEELLQETFFQCFKSISSFKGNSTIKTWIYAIARNVYLKNLQKNKKSEVNLESVEIMDKGNCPTHSYEDKEAVTNILCKIEGIEEPYKQVLILRAINELSFKEIGVILGKTESYARVTFHRAKAKLGKELDYEGY